MNKNFKIEKPKPVCDKHGNIKYYEDDDYIYVKKKGEYFDVK